MLTDRCALLKTALQETFRHWDCTLDGDHITLQYGGSRTAPRPPRRAPSSSRVLTNFVEAAAARGIQRGRILPLRGLSDAELTFSAVQALDPYLKRGQPRVHTHGLLPQPVVRFTGPRDACGTLLPGFATSFVNLSIVEPINHAHDHVALIDTWISILSAIGFHAQHLTISGHLTVWHRGPVSGITLKIDHCGQELGDAILLWNNEDPEKLATDIGTGLERIVWLLTDQTWEQTVYGTLIQQLDIRLLDALRTATLVAGNGIRLSSRGPGSAIRRLLHAETKSMDGLGLSRIVRWAHGYWSRFQLLPVPWHEVCRVLDTELLEHA